MSGSVSRRRELRRPLRHAAPVLLCLLLGFTMQVHGELLYEGFESLSVGQSVEALQGWGMLDAGDVACVAVSNHVFLGSRALKVTHQVSLFDNMWSSSAFTNFNCIYRSTNHPVIRMSVMLYRENNKQLVQLGLGRGTNLQVWVGSSASREAIVVNTYTTAVNFVTNRFASLTLLYNMANNQASLDYDGVNIMPWRLVGASVSTQFNLLAVRRYLPMADLTTSGDVIVDQAVVETFPPATKAWFRFEDENHDQLTDQTGSFRPAPLYFTGSFAPSAWSQLKIENGVTHNRNAYRNAISSGEA
ncbi:MAG: hypothetical protein V2A34_01975, partial [Lentisphaerota bacterium]